MAQGKQVNEIFADDSRGSREEVRKPRKKCVVAIMKSDLVLRSLVNLEPHVKQVIDWVRYLFDTRCTVDPVELP